MSVLFQLTMFHVHVHFCVDVLAYMHVYQLYLITVTILAIFIIIFFLLKSAFHFLLKFKTDSEYLKKCI